MTSNTAHITIVGAGIAGLVAAISLRNHGHEVTIFEQSSLAKEIGAAFSITPNASSVLSNLGIDTHDGGAVDFRAHVFLGRDGQVLREAPINPKFQNLPAGESWTFAHRYHLHEQLKSKADEVGVTLLTGKRLSSIDPDQLQISFEDGTTHQAQVLLGADGVHSKVREVLSEIRPSATPWAVFRFMLNREEVERCKPSCEDIFHPGKVYLWGQSGTSFLAYPTSHDTQLNFVGIFPVEVLNIESGIDTQYSQKASKEQARYVFKDFDPRIQGLIELADPTGFRYWPLMDMEDLSSYVGKDVALLGDAAHPYLPFAYQGAGLAIEDGAAVAALLAGCDREEVNTRLAQYEKLRHVRCAQKQQFSRNIYKDHSNDPDWNPESEFENIYLYRVLEEVEKIKREA